MLRLCKKKRGPNSRPVACSFTSDLVWSHHSCHKTQYVLKKKNYFTQRKCVCGAALCGRVLQLGYDLKDWPLGGANFTFIYFKVNLKPTPSTWLRASRQPSADLIPTVPCPCRIRTVMWTPLCLLRYVGTLQGWGIKLLVSVNCQKDWTRKAHCLR